MHSAGLELTKLTYNTRLDDTLMIRHRGYGATGLKDVFFFFFHPPADGEK